MMRSTDPIILPGAENVSCPVCLASAMRISRVVVKVDTHRPEWASVAYSAHCGECGFTTSRDKVVRMSDLVASYIVQDLQRHSRGR